MVKKNQLKGYSLQQLKNHSQHQKDGQTLTIINQIIKQRNQTLNQKQNCLKKELLSIRKDTNKTIKQMNQAVRDRLAKKYKITMDKNSRPTNDDIKELTELFIYMENQTNLIDRNNNDIDEVLIRKNHQHSIINAPSINNYQQFIKLDQQCARLNIQCEKQHVKLKLKQQQLQSFNHHISNIHSTIQEYRLKYQIVQSAIREKQRQLDHLVTYFKNRKQQDEQNIQRQKKLTNILENQLLKAQVILNFSQNKNDQFKIKEIQFSEN